MQETTEEKPTGDLLELVRDAHVGLAAIELRRRGKRVKRWTLTTGEDGRDVAKADDVPDDSPADIVALVVDAAEQHAAKHGTGRYHVALEPVEGKTRPYVLAVGESETDSPKQRNEENAVQFAERLMGHVLELVTKLPQVLDRMVSMADKVAQAHANVMVAREASSGNQLQLALLQQEAATAARREQFASETIKPFLAAVRAKWGLAAPKAQAAVAVEPVVAHARELYRSTTVEQQQTLRTLLGSEAVDALRDGDASRIVAAVADIVGRDDATLEQATNVLRDEQHPMLASLASAAQKWRAPAAAEVAALPATTE